MFRFFKKTSIITIILAFTVYEPALAYNGGDLCEALLNEGIKDTQAVNVSQYQFNEIHSEVCNANYDSFQKAQSESSSGSLDVPGYFGISASDANADSEYSTKWSNFCSSDYGQSTSNSQISSYVSTINDAILQSFDHCVSLNSDTFVRYVQPDPSGKVFTVVFRNRVEGIPGFTVVQLTMLDTTSGKALDPTKDCDLAHHLPYNTGGFDVLQILCKKPADDVVVVSGTTTSGVIDTVTVPAVPSTPPTIADRVSSLEGEVSSLTAQLNASEANQTTTIKSIQGQVGNLQIGFQTYRTPNATKGDTIYESFPFTVVHAWVVPWANMQDASEFDTSWNGGTVTVTFKLNGSGGGGPGLDYFNVWATSF